MKTKKDIKHEELKAKQNWLSRLNVGAENFRNLLADVKDDEGQFTVSRHFTEALTAMVSRCGHLYQMLDDDLRGKERKLDEETKRKQRVSRQLSKLSSDERNIAASKNNELLNRERLLEELDKLREQEGLLEASLAELRRQIMLKDRKVQHGMKRDVPKKDRNSPPKTQVWKAD